MKTVKVNRKRLREILKENLEKHKTDLEKMAINYRHEMITKLQDHLSVFKEAQGPQDILDIGSIMWPTKPVSHVDDYNKAIRMLDLSVDDVIELDEREFTKLVMDEWAWKQEFELSKTLYGV